MRNDSGFTFLEFLVATAIFAIGAAGVASMQLAAMRTGNSAYEFDKALSLARSKIEYLKNIKVDSTSAPSAHCAQTASGADDIYSVSCTVEPFSTSARRIRVTVEWKKSGKQKRLDLSTITRGDRI